MTHALLEHARMHAKVAVRERLRSTYVTIFRKFGLWKLFTSHKIFIILELVTLIVTTSTIRGQRRVILNFVVHLRF